MQSADKPPSPCPESTSGSAAVFLPAPGPGLKSEQVLFVGSSNESDFETLFPTAWSRIASALPSARRMPYKPTVEQTSNWVSSLCKECAVCAEEKPIADFERPTTLCSHALIICRRCVQRSLVVAVIENGHVVLATYEHLSSQRALEADPGFRWCPRNGCGNGQLVDDIEGSRFWTCSECKCKICIRHRSLFHDGLTCDDFDKLATWKGRWLRVAARAFRPFRWRRAQRLPAGEEGAAIDAEERRARELAARKREEAASLAALRKLRVKRCPKCGQGLQKTGGCDHFICASPAGCQAQFNWSGADWAGGRSA
ncbi:hypothetical protein KFL_002390060 [Klebsormidium nitens]|uniref:RBR-type E3 ubiquitin transferase n=1 Tax=Klebsormidium nitens TaxID=105231 RepID=A0A1Y1I3K5_KLENI|nr:hypothetical protein KFL_002390060 [Klebsormidium nitens]|eukprot:GAQ85514.1 hypothetical protein KFL_002390060 [Klebsormidium nitens]